MKNILKLAICTGITFPLIASAQIVVNGPNTDTTPTVGGSFHNLVIAMSSDVGSLYTPEGDSLSLADPVYFNYNSSGAGFMGMWEAGSAPTEFSIKFEVVPNFPKFFFTNDTNEEAKLDIGFIGEESRHNNTFGFVEGGSYTQLNNWNAGGDTAPMSWQLTSANTTSIMFEQNNLTEGSNGLQADSNRFRIFGVYDDPDENNPNRQLTGEYLFAIADRDGEVDGDYDDGFFYVIGDITPVPEPSQIAALALAGLGGLLYVRRRIARRRK